MITNKPLKKAICQGNASHFVLNPVMTYNECALSYSFVIKCVCLLFYCVVSIKAKADRENDCAYGLHLYFTLCEDDVQRSEQRKRETTKPSY